MTNDQISARSVPGAAVEPRTPTWEQAAGVCGCVVQRSKCLIKYRISCPHRHSPSHSPFVLSRISHRAEMAQNRQRSSGLVDNVIAESRRPFSWCVAVLYFPDVDERKTSLEIVPISKISNSRGADQKYKLNCNGKAIMYRVNHVMPRGLP
ncbi:hypothetical protein J6590_004382 [Homalodisca vitripennis]|nr:hypothetical protein J6590_004382 [Homalodisca vitripennis]